MAHDLAFAYGEFNGRDFEATSVAVSETLLFPIESVPLGSRVGTKNPTHEYDDEFGEPSQDSWRLMSATIERHDGAVIDFEYLRPLSWLEARGITPGSSLNVALPELDLFAVGTVHRIEPCPPIADGEGSVVTGRIVTRQTAGLVRVEFTRGEPLTGTEVHPVWSLDRQDWVGLGDLQPLERVAAQDGETIVLSVTPLAELAPVFNLEIHGEHVYQVTTQGVLVHNAGGLGEPCKVAASGVFGQLQRKFDELAEAQLLPKYRALDPNLKWGYTGSFKTGKVGNPSKPTFGQPIDLSKFDVDVWIESDILYKKFGSNLRADVEFRKLLSKTPGFEGLKPNKQGFSIKFKPSSAD